MSSTVETTEKYVVRSYEKIETLLEKKKKRLLSSYCETLEAMFSKLLSTRPLNFFPGQTIELPMPESLDSYDYSRFITDENLEKISIDLSKIFEPLVIKIKWKSSMSFSSSSSCTEKIVATINFCENESTSRELSFVASANKEMCRVNEWIINDIDKIFVNYNNQISELLNKFFDAKNFPKCLDQTEFCNLELKYDSSHFLLYNLSNRDITKSISNYFNTKLSEKMKKYFPVAYPNFKIFEHIESDFYSGFLTGHNFTIKIKLTYLYSILQTPYKL
jgi:hypothetical protein